MTYADELLELAKDVADLPNPYSHQPSLRRANSTAYYALFHLLISEATLNGSRPEFRAALGRVFDHRQMKQAADKKVSELRNYFSQKLPEGRERTVAFYLHNVANTFLHPQFYRNDADYNTATEWELDEVLTQIDDIGEAFKSWKIIRDEPPAQAYLVSMLLSRERKQNERPSRGTRPTVMDAP